MKGYRSMRENLFNNSWCINRKSVILLIALLGLLTNNASAESTLVKGSGPSHPNGSNMFQVYIENNASEPIRLIDLNASEMKNGAVVWSRYSPVSIHTKGSLQVSLIYSTPRYGEDIIFPPGMRWQSGIVLIGESSGFLYGRVYLTSGKDLIKSNNLITSDFKSYFTTPSDLTIQYDNKCLYSYENSKETDQSKKSDACITIGAIEWNPVTRADDQFVLPHTDKLEIRDMDQKPVYGLKVHIPITINSVPTEVSP